MEQIDKNRIMQNVYRVLNESEVRKQGNVQITENFDREPRVAIGKQKTPRKG